MVMVNKRTLNRKALDVIMAVKAYEDFLTNDRAIYPERESDGGIRELSRKYYFAIPDATMSLAGLRKTEHDWKGLGLFGVTCEMKSSRPQDLSRFPLWESESEGGA